MNKALGMIGLAKRAGKVQTGEFLSEKSVKSGQSRLIIIARDISENGRKAITDACKHYNVDYIELGTCEELGNITGTGKRAVVSVNDENFRNAILSKIERVDK